MPHVLGDESARRLKRLLYSPDGRNVNNPSQPSGPTTVPPLWHHARVTGSSSTSGSNKYYPAVIAVWDTIEDDVVDYEDIWLLNLNQKRLVDGDYYDAKAAGEITISSSTKRLYTCAVPFGIAEGTDTTGCDVADTITLYRLRCVDSITLTDTITITLPANGLICTEEDS